MCVYGERGRGNLNQHVYHIQDEKNSSRCIGTSIPLLLLLIGLYPLGGKVSTKRSIHVDNVASLAEGSIKP